MGSYRDEEERNLARALDGADLLFVDFEASSLNQKRSYPIQFGWQRVAAGKLADAGAFLIRTAAAWDVPGAWSNEAARVHGIGKEELADGVATTEAAARTRELVGDAVVVGDAPSYDRHWWRVLLDELPGKPKPPVMVDLDELSMRLVEAFGGSPATILAAREEARALRPPTHRADDDAAYLAQRWVRLRQLLGL